MFDPVRCVRCGLVPYEEGVVAQQAIADARRAGELPDVLLLLEHPPVYTCGRRTEPAELPMGEDWYRMQGIEVCDTDRGGRVTYHGPGQLVGYPIVDLSAYGDDVHAYVRSLERVMIGSLGELGVAAQVIDGLTGVWSSGQAPFPAGTTGPQGTAVGEGVGEGEARKIGAIGIHVSKGITTHGLAINVSNDLQPFEWIQPCGMEAARTTSVTAERRERVEVDELASVLVETYAETLERDPVETSAEELAGVVPGAEPLLGTAAPS